MQLNLGPMEPAAIMKATDALSGEGAAESAEAKAMRLRSRFTSPDTSATAKGCQHEEDEEPRIPARRPPGGRPVSGEGLPSPVVRWLTSLVEPWKPWRGTLYACRAC